MSLLKNLFLIIPVMIYYFIESMISGLFVMLVYDNMLYQLFTYEVSYKQWVCMIWIIKVIFFDVFKFNHTTNDVFENNNANTNENNNNNNVTLS